MEQDNTILEQGGTPENTTPQEGTSAHTNMEALLEQEGLALDFPQQGEIRSGTIASISATQILVSVGAKSEGVITGRELEQIPEEEREALQVGQEVSVYVLAAEDANGTIVLSYTRALEQQSWEIVEQMMEDSEPFDGKVDGYNKGGLIVPVRGLRGFVPASQISIARRMQISGDTPDQRWGKMIGEPITVRVIEVDRNRRRLILSERAASNETRQSIKERVIEELQEGAICEGRVTSLADFGAFVNVNGADGLVHLSEISWDRVQHPSEVLEVGQDVQVKVINIDRERKRIGLSIRALQDDPWRQKVDKYKVGQLVEGVITRLTKFGAFARIEGDLEGLIHISEISERRIEHPKEVIKDGDVVALRIIRVDPDQRRIGLSMRKVDSGAYKDLDLKQIDLEDVGPELVEAEVELEVQPQAAIEPEAELEVQPEAAIEPEAELEVQPQAAIEPEVELEQPSEATPEPESAPEPERVAEETEEPGEPSPESGEPSEETTED
ncbi:MAG: S1 RNA-binding domain-containing protein [Anaerolineales bacterium]|nr:S1 RNA-binding domain-containing protein [Anaerolineales bacterium]